MPLVLDPVRDPVVNAQIADMHALPSFDAAAKTVLQYLRATFSVGLWMVTRTAGADWVVLHSAGDAYPVSDGDVFVWSDSVCSRMVRGEGPRVARHAADFPAYAEAPSRRRLEVGGYVGIPLTSPDGTLFGTLCGVDPGPLSAEVIAAQPLFELQARLLSSLLAVELTATAQERRSVGAEVLLDPAGWTDHVAAEQLRASRHADPVSVLAFGPWLDRSDRDLALLRQALRPQDGLGQASDGVVALLLPGMPEALAQVRATEVLQRLNQAGLTVGCGVASLDPRDGDLAAACDRAVEDLRIAG